MKVVKTLKGRVIHEVPKEYWLLKDEPEHQIDCMNCGKPIRYFKYDSIPRRHNGHCTVVNQDVNVINKAVRERKKRNK